MILKESNSLFSALLSQKNKWEVQEIIELAESILTPFQGIDFANIESSNDVSMLLDIARILPYKINCFKYIVRTIKSNNGLECNELDVNIFNSDCGLDSIALLIALDNNGFDLSNIKSVRLFCNKEDALRRSLLIHNYIFPNINVKPFLTELKNITSECKCESLLTINIFPHCNSLYKNIATKIGNLLIQSHQLYSHTIFFEFVDSDDIRSIPTLNCSYYWQDLNQTKFVKEASSNYQYQPKLESNKAHHKSKYCIFSNTSLDALEFSHEYKIILEGLCPGVYSRSLFNEKQRLLFFDKPFKDTSELDAQFDSETIVASEFIYSKNDYTLLKAIKEFPQYSIAEALNTPNSWANTLFDFYLESANNGNYKCYNCIAVLLMLKNWDNEEIKNIDSEVNKLIIGYWEKAIEGEDVNAMINLASLYMEKGFPEKAYKYYNLAYQNGSSCGAYSVAVAHHFGLCGIPQNHNKAIDCYRNFFDLLKKGRDSDADNSAPENQNCINLIILMYKKGYGLCEITKEYNKVKKPSKDLTYAYTVISNNLSNKAKDFFKVLRLLETPDEKEASYIKFNRLYALQKGVKNGNNTLTANPKQAYEELKKLADTKCPDWPDWEKYVWSNLGHWAHDLKESSVIVTSYWLKAANANPSRECAYKTNIATFGTISNEEKKAIWHKYAFGNGCSTCHECGNYDATANCCPKAQLKWAKEYESDKSLSSYLLGLAVNQNYVPAINEIAINRILKELEPNQKLNVFENLNFNVGIVPDKLLPYLDKFYSDKNYNLLCIAAERGNRRAAGLLVELSKKYRSNYENYYWEFQSLNCLKKFHLLSTLSGRTLTDGFFDADTLLDIDFLKLADKIAEQFIGPKESAFEHLEKLAQFYIAGEYYNKALNLYKIAKEKEFDVDSKISEIEDIIEENNRIYNRNNYYDYYDDYDSDDYMRDTWDALTDGMYGDMPDGWDGDYSFLGYD